MHKTVTTVGLALALLLSGGAAQAADEDAIEYRQHIMKALNAQSAILGQIVSGLVPDDQLVEHLDIMAMLAATSKKSFEPKVAGGESKAEVWSQWPDFAKRMDEFASKTAEAAKIAHTQGGQAALSNMLDVLSCKSCHDVYRSK